MNRLPFDFRKLLLVLFVFALPLVSINFQRLPGEEPWYMIPIAYVSGGVEFLYTGISGFVRGTTSEYMNLINIKKQSRSLTAELQTLKARMAAFDEIQKENERFAKLLDFKTATPGKLLPAQIIGLDLMSNHSTLRLNRGSLDGIVKGQAVISGTGVVGTIFSVENKTSRVLVITDRYSVIDATIQRTRARGIVEGKSSISCRLKYLQRTDDVQIGDLVVTSGLDETFPKGFPIGTVTDIEKKAYGVSQKVEVSPLVDPSRLDEVLIINELPHQGYSYPTKVPYSSESGPAGASVASSSSDKAASAASPTKHKTPAPPKKETKP